MSSFVPERPTLPPLRSLALPMHGVPSKMTLPGLCNGQQDPAYSPPSQGWQSRRPDSVSSPTTFHAPYPPPPPSIAGPLAYTLYNSTATHSFHMHQTNAAEPHVRLVLTDSLENADAVLVLSSTSASNASGAPRVISSPDALGGIKPGPPLLIVGAALGRIRRPGTVLGKGVKMHPYRIVPSTSTISKPPMTSGTHYSSRK